MLALLYYGVFALVCGGVLCSFFLLKNRVSENWSKIFKILSLVMIVFFSAYYLVGYPDIEAVLGLVINSPISSPFLTWLASLMLWLFIASVLCILIYAFFKLNFLRNLVRFLAVPALILNFIFLWNTAVGISGAALNVFDIQTLFYSITSALALALALYVFIREGAFKITKKEFLQFLGALAPVLIVTMPAYILHVWFGYVNPTIQVDDLNFYHRVAIYLMFIIPTIIYFMLRKKDAETIRASLLFISLATLITFMINYDYTVWLNPTLWPFHLCNTAMFIIPLCLIFKWEKLFYFTLFINVLGAFFAMVMPSYEVINLFSTNLYVFWVNHYIAFFMPVLIVLLKVYQRPKLKFFYYSMVGFAIYFGLMLILNAWFTNYRPDVDFFFINSDFIADKLGVWAENLRNIIWSFSIGGLTFTYYPLYQVLFFLVYVLLGLGMWFVYTYLFQILDSYKEMLEKRKKINLDKLALMAKLDGRSLDEPMNLENVNQLVIKDFSKKYGSSDVYAVKNASLTINGGEIFGFLGPNGAGKSTIIKSIVGIQPFSSGEISINGYDVEKQSVEAKRQIGFVPDHYALYEKLTGREYINYIADLYDVSKQDRDERIEKYVKMFELETAFDNQMKTYSHGMKQKIAIMSALIHNPKLWILDEPLTGLDPTSIFQVKECMKQHAKEGNIVFFSSHIIDVVEKICTRIAIIKKGEIQCTKTIEEINDSGELLEDFYLKAIGQKKEDLD